MSFPSLPPAAVAGRRWFHGGLQCTALGLSAALLLSACNETTNSATEPGVALQPAQPQPVAYQPPQAEVLYRMVAPIALYPDKLVAQVLAASTYPDQVGAAETWLAQNPGLKGADQARTVNEQPWDPSVKSLTQFPNVLEQMAANLPWTTALGKAYYHDPADVMNAIQVMRGRAYRAGTLKDSDRMRVSVAAQPAAQAYAPAPGLAATMPLPVPVIQAPPQFIEIAPAVVDTVYVPQYDPALAYGAPLPVYGGYSYAVAPPMVVGLVGFGAGVLLAEPAWRRPWGWHAWGMHWGEPDRRWHAGEPPPPPMARPAVVYNNTTYISHSTTVVNNQVNIGRPGPAPVLNANAQAMPPGPHPAMMGAAAGAADAAVGAAALALRPPLPGPAGPQGGTGLQLRQPPAAMPLHADRMPPAGPGRNPAQGTPQLPGLAFGQRPGAMPGQGHPPMAALPARPPAMTAMPAQQGRFAPAPGPQGAQAMHGPAPRMLAQEQQRMRAQA
ncbi:MAG: DUF3300 domain-containing protein, partial [Proteobacteria bacterium]|nr:DUF3300 domain-containing protein [Pseudomonadota bacterium]